MPIRLLSAFGIVEGALETGAELGVCSRADRGFGFGLAHIYMLFRASWLAIWYKVVLDLTADSYEWNGKGTWSWFG